jgi:cell division protein FtsQ
MAQTIRRGGKGVRRVAAQRGAKAKVQTARKQTGSAIGHVLRVQPFSEETLHRILLTLILGTAAVLVWTVANVAACRRCWKARWPARPMAPGSM